MKTLAEQFASFHARNPHVYRKFCQNAKSYLSRGKKLKGAEIMDLVRRDRGVKTSEQRAVGRKIDNNYTSFYSRMFNEDYPEYDNPFQVKKRKIDKPKDKVSFYDH